MEPDKKRIRLDEVTLMRAILALLIVFMYAFTCYQGGWAQPVGYVDVPAYMWLARSSFAFTLEGFVFISGYLFAFQQITIKRSGYGVGKLIMNKLKRLILPSIVFSALYFSLFYKYNGIPDLVYNLLNGCGHMWFLPMLFWCFISAWLIERVRIGDGWKMVFLVCLNLFSFFSLPLQISTAANYLVYFYGGYVVYKHSEAIKATIHFKHIIWSWIVFIALFVVLRPLKDTFEVGDQVGILNKVITLSGRNACQLIYASVGTFSFYITVLYYIQRHKLKAVTIQFASCCFGIYLFQQFVLQFLFYKTSIPLVVGPYWLPWCGFLIALVLSYLLTELSLRTKIGKFLIG